MAVRRYNPVTPGTRFKVANTFTELTVGNQPERSLLAKISKSGGRNQSGKMTMRYIGGGHKKRYRVIDFKRSKQGIEATVKTVEYDPNRSCFISLIEYTDGELNYIIAPNGIKVDQKVMSGPGSDPNVGNALPLSEVPLGSLIHNIEIKPGQGGKMSRSAGSYCQLLARNEKYATLKMPSGEARMILVTCLATIGSVSNPDHNQVYSGKAGRSRWLGRRPRVRGVAMNPVDHPMGGGEGRASGGHPRSRKGLLSKGFKTRDKKKASDKYIVDRRKK
ncbi:MAG: 50S ribosomal protein L2 [Flavobacteriaceae bacterium]|nr:50S ribosomal protein L2 [Flavobacteriaceae bacterium]